MEDGNPYRAPEHYANARPRSLTAQSSPCLAHWHLSWWGAFGYSVGYWSGRFR